MPLLGSLNTFVVDTTIDQDEVNENFTDIRSWANSSVVLTDVAKTISAVHDFTGGLKADTISESTAAAGVTVDGVLLKDGKVGATYGGTDQTSWTLGDLLYASAANTLSKLAGNSAATKKFLQQTGDGVNSAAPSWGALVADDYPTMVGATSSTAGTKGAVPQPLAGDEDKFLKGDGTYGTAGVFVGVVAAQTSTQTLTTGTETKITLTSEEIDTHSAFASSTFTCPTGWAGAWEFTGTVCFTSSLGAASRRAALLYKNGSRIRRNESGDPDEVISIVVTATLDLAEGDTIDLYGWQFSGGNLDTFVGDGSACRFEAKFVGTT